MIEDLLFTGSPVYSYSRSATVTLRTRGYSVAVALLHVLHDPNPGIQSSYSSVLEYLVFHDRDIEIEPSVLRVVLFSPQCLEWPLWHTGTGMASMAPPGSINMAIGTQNTRSASVLECTGTRVPGAAIIAIAINVPVQYVPVHVYVRVIHVVSIASCYCNIL